MVGQGPSKRQRHEGKEGRITIQPLYIALILVAFSLVQVAAYTAFRSADFRGFSSSSIVPLLKDTTFWIGVACSMGVFVFSFTLVRISESSLVLVLFLYLNSILVYFVLLPITWRFVFHEQIFTSAERVLSFVLAVFSGVMLLIAMYLWNRGG
jgi:hypothetical protein